MAHSLKIYGLGAITFLFYSCKHLETKPVSIRNSDTTEVIRVLLDTAINHGALFGNASLKNYPLFTDTVIFEASPGLSRNIADAIQGKKYKVLSEEQICSLVTANFNLKSPGTYQMNFLRIKRFLNIKEGYFVELHNTLLTPPQYLADLHPGNKACIADEATNSGIMMLFIRKHKSFEGKITNHWKAFPTAANISFMQ